MKREESLIECYNKDIRPYIDVIDELRRIGVEQDVSLPNVVVVGDQSSGKSSIIEALSGIQLPRGTGIVTRCPLELQLKQTYNPNSISNYQWKAILKYGKQEKSTYEREEVGEMIRIAQNELCGSGKDVSNELLTLRIEDPHPNAPDLTLIDLPGISRTPVNGQSANVCQVIRDMVYQYITPENTVILCMIAANLDFAVNESLVIAKSVDVDQKRTIGVITKPDLANKQQCREVMEVLNNTKYPLMKGYIIVKCRSQDELDENLSLEDSRANEMDYFDRNVNYQYADSKCKGIDNLSAKITEELVNVIKMSLPDLKMKIDNGIQQAQQQLTMIPESIPGEKHQKYVFLTKAMYDLCSIFREFLLNGCLENATENGYSFWRKDFQTFLTSIETKRKDAMKSKFEIRNLQCLIEKNRGSEINHFVSHKLFKSQVQQYLANYQIDADLLAESIHKRLQTILIKEAEEKFKHLPAVKRDIKNEISVSCKECLKNCKDTMKLILDQEKIVFSMDTLFTEELENQLSIEQQMREQTKNKMVNISDEYMSANSSSNAEYLQRLLKVYLKIANKRLSDRIPLTASQCLFVNLEDKLKTEFMTYSSKIDIDANVQENKKLTEERKKWIDKINRLSEAQHKLVSF